MKNNYISQLHFTSKLFLLSLFIMIGFSSVVVGQTTLAKWTFPNGTNTGKCNEYSANNVGKTLIITASTNTNGSVGYLLTGASGGTDKCASATRWDNGANTYNFLFENINTTSFSSVTFSAKVSAGNNNAPLDFKIQYRVNNGGWNDIGNAFTFTNINTWNSIASYLILPAGAANQEDVDIRILQTSNTSIGGGSIGTGGGAWVGVDDVLVEGESTSTQTVVIGYKSGIPQTDGNYNENHTLNSSFRTATMSKLSSASNFGPSGTSPFTIVFYDFKTKPITKAALEANNVNILDLGISDGDAWSGTLVDSYTAAEVNEIKLWTKSSLSNVVLAFQGYATALGGPNYVAEDANVGQNNITTLGASILNGPFGDFTPFNQSGNYTGIFNKEDANSCRLIMDDLTKSPTGLVDNATGDIYLADVGLLERYAGLTDGSLIKTSTDILVANLYNGLAQISQNQPLSACQFFSCTAGINGPKLSATSISIKCPATSTNLNSLVVGALPAGTTLRWFTTSTHAAGTEVANPASVTAGTYYAFYYGGTDDCFSPYTMVVAESGITISTNTLTDFSYVFGSGPSAMQTLIVSGACLTYPIVITPPVNSKYEISVDGINWQTSPVTLPLTTPAPNGVVENTNIYVRLIKELAVGTYTATIPLTSTGADPKNVALTGRVVEYCTPSTTNPGIIYISSVTFNGNTNPSPSSSYTDFTSINYDVNKGNSYNLSVNIYADAGRQGYYTAYCKVWIDWNHDGDFNDIGESYDLGKTRGKNTTTDASPYSITVPIGAMVGKTRMRVSCSYYANELDPCATITYGEVEDYSITILKNYWQGTSTSTDWSLGSNWTAGVVPADGDDVEYLNGTASNTAQNDLKLDTDRTIGNLINATTKRLIIPAGKSLKINGSIQTGGVDDKILIKTRTATPVVANGSLIFPNAYGVHATVEMYSRAYKGPVVTLPDKTSYSYNWQFFGIPLTQVVADPTFAGSYVRIYNESQPGERTKWTQLINSSKLYPFKGYEITQKDSTTIFFRGELVNRSTTISLPYTTTTGVFERGQHILSNPYTAAIDVRKLIFGSDTERTVYLYTTGSFANWYNSGGGTTYDDTSASAGQYLAIPQRVAGKEDGLTNDIPSMSSFVVKATDTKGINPGSVTINYGSVIFKNAHAQRVKSTSSANLSATDLISTKIDLIGQHYADRMWIFTEPSCTKNFDNGWDGRKILGSSLAPQIYAVEPDGDYQVNSVDDMHDTDIAFQPGDEVEYTMKFTNENIKRKYAGVYLVDLVENKTIDVTESGSTYKFATAPASEPSKRFKIITRAYEKEDADAQLKIFGTQGTIFVHNQSAVAGYALLYDMSGRFLQKLPFDGGAVTAFPMNIIPGAYIVKAITKNEEVTKRLIISGGE